MIPKAGPLVSLLGAVSERTVIVIGRVSSRIAIVYGYLIKPRSSAYGVDEPQRAASERLSANICPRLGRCTFWCVVKLIRSSVFCFFFPCLFSCWKSLYLVSCFNVCCIDVNFYSDYILLLLFIQDYYNKGNIPIILIGSIIFGEPL